MPDPGGEVEPAARAGTLARARVALARRGLDLLEEIGRVALDDTPSLRWRRSFGAQRWVMEVAAGHGLLFVLGSQRSFDTDLCALDPETGALRWSVPGARDDPSAGLAVAEMGVVFVHESREGGPSVVEVFDPTGRRVVRTEVPGRSRGAPPAVAGGIAVVAVHDGGRGHAVAVDLTSGAVRWQQTIPFRPAWGDAPVVVDDEGRPLVAVAGDPSRPGDDGGVIGLDLDSGRERWRRRGGAWDNLRAGNGTVVAIEWEVRPDDWRERGAWRRPSEPRRTTLWGLDPAGGLRWRHEDARWVYATPGAIVLTRWGRPCVGLDPLSGAPRWELSSVARVAGVVRGVLVGAVAADEVVAWDATSGQRLWRMPLPTDVDAFGMLATDGAGTLVLAGRRELLAVSPPHRAVERRAELRRELRR